MVFSLLSLLILVLKMQVSLSVDLEKLPTDAWENRKGINGCYYRRYHYHLGLSFGAGGIEWRLLHKNKVIGSVKCKYS
jgi:hypothetical protein